MKLINIISYLVRNKISFDLRVENDDFNICIDNREKLKPKQIDYLVKNGFTYYKNGGLYLIK